MFEALPLLDHIRRWVEIESPTERPDQVNKLVDLVVADHAGLPVTLERVPGREGRGDHLVVRSTWGQDAPGILILSHLDTVHPMGFIEKRLPYRVDGDVAFGPGIYDMKAGACIAHHALRAVGKMGGGKLGVTHLYVSDEEVGSPTSQALIETLGRKAKYVLVTEPARDGGKIVTARKGVGRFDVHIRGVASHAGAKPHEGRSAVRELGHVILALEGLCDDAQRQKWLPSLVSMEKCASYCLTEPGAGSDAAALSTRAVKDGDFYVLTGQKQFISGAGNADDFYVVMARSGGEGPKGISTFVVEGGTPGLSFGANERKMGWNAQPTRAVIFDNCRIPAANLIGKEGDGFKIAMSGLDGGRLNIAACSVGGAQAALDKALAYTNERKAFGKKLNEFQALQFRLADLAIELEAARLFLYSAAASYDRGDADKTTHIAMAKRFVTDTGFDVANGALQLLGGYGYLSEYGMEKIVRDLRVHQILEGTNEIMRLIVARALLAETR